GIAGDALHDRRRQAGPAALRGRGLRAPSPSPPGADPGLAPLQWRARRVNLMRLTLPAVLLVSSLGLSLAASAPAPAGSPSPAAPGPAPPGAPASPSGSPPPYAAENEKYVAALEKSIQGKEDQPAKDVFKNVKMLGEVPASRLLRTMQDFTRSLGVSCTKCHDPEKWDSDQKDEKETTRTMMTMTRAINDEYIKKIAAIADDKPSVSCFTCHRGDVHAGVAHPPGH